MSRALADNVIADFGREWQRFDQSGVAAAEERAGFEAYFRIFPWAELPFNAIGLDLGCGSGRWAVHVAPRVGHLHCLDPGAALAVAQRRLAQQPNCTFHQAPAEAIPLPDASLDFAFSLGVLHHVPDTAACLRQLASKLKPGAPFLIYLYYAFDNRPAWYRGLWQLSNTLRRGICALPSRLKFAVCDLLAALVYWPLARLAALAERCGVNPERLPLAFYRHRSFYVMRNDALDRFGTRLEKRFTRAQIEALLHDAGFERVTFSPAMPFWCALAYHRN